MNKAYYRQRNVKFPVKEFFAGLFVVLLALAIIGLLPYYQYGTVETVTVTVKSKERVNSRESSKYLVFAEGETFQNTDTIWHGKWSSSDLYGSLNEGTKYRLRVYGWRIPFFSAYRNILEATPVTE